MNFKKFIILSASVALLATGCGNKADTASFSPTESSIYVTREGKVTSATIEKFEGTGYTEEELRASAEEDLETVNGPAGAKSADGKEPEKAAEVSECSIKDGVIKLLVDFKDTNTYLQYLETYPDEEDETVKSLDITTVSDGLTKGYLVDAEFKKTGDGKPVAFGEISKQGDLYVAAVQGAALIQPDGKIQYVSENVTVTGGNMVHTPEDGVSYIVFK